MLSRLGSVAAAVALLAVVPASGSPPRRLGGIPYALIGTDDALWALACDRGCRREARHSEGRVLRLDPRTGRVLATVRLPRPQSLALGAGALYAVDFWRDTVRRIEPGTLRVSRTPRLALPFRFTERDNAFLPYQAAAGASGLWVATARCALAHADADARRVVATIRLPCAAFGGLALGPGAVWVGESLLGVYRIDPRRHRVVWRGRIGPPRARLAVDEVLAGRGTVLALGTWTKHGVATPRRGLARIDAASDRIVGVTDLPSGGLVSALARGSLWVGRIGGDEVERIDPRSGRVSARLPFRVGRVLAVAGNRIWTADLDGMLRSRELG